MAARVWEATPEGLRELIARQSGVVARFQLLEAGLADHDVRRLRRRRELTGVTCGVYVDHTGPLSWTQQAWVAVLHLWPAALCHRSALRAEGLASGCGRDERVIHVAVARDRSPAAPAGVRLHRITDLQARTRWTASPPRLHLEHAVLDVASSATRPISTVATLADAVQSRRTTPDRLRAALDTRPRIARRRLIEGVLLSLEDGAESALEEGYRRLVECAHGLPAGRRQARREQGLAGHYDDVRYEKYGLGVELDGRAFHDTSAARDRDLERDLDSQLVGRDTLRLGWGQVFDRPCATAAKMAGLLRRRGWGGALQPCPRCPAPAVGPLTPAAAPDTRRRRTGPGARPQSPR